MDDEDNFKGRFTRQGEEAIGRLAQELLENKVVSGALSAAFETRERAVRAQEVAMGALGLPSAADLERLTRRVRSVSQRLEGIEDGLDRLDDRLARADSARGLEERLSKIEAVLERLEASSAAGAPARARTARSQTARTQAARTAARTQAARTEAQTQAARTEAARTAGRGAAGSRSKPATRPRKPPAAG